MVDAIPKRQTTVHVRIGHVNEGAAIQTAARPDQAADRQSGADTEHGKGPFFLHMSKNTDLGHAGRMLPPLLRSHPPFAENSVAVFWTLGLSQILEREIPFLAVCSLPEAILVSNEHNG